MASASTNDLTPGSTFGRYRIVRRLAIGGMNEIFLAEDPRSGTTCVLKVPIADGASLAERREAIGAEAALGRGLAHPAIVRVLGEVHDDGHSALVSEFVDGVRLADVIDASPHGPEFDAVALRVVVTLAEALEHVHRARHDDGSALGIVHRDITPTNILVDRRGQPKLLDFGIARTTRARVRTKTGTLKGTLRYLSPEQATGSELDARSDVYALAMLGFELLTGAPYLVGSSDVELLRAAEAPEPRDLPERLPPDVRRAFQAALARFPEERPSSAGAFAQRLEPHAASPEAARRTLAALVAARSRVETTRPRSHAGSLRILVPVVALGVFGVLVWFASAHRARPPQPSHRPAAVAPSSRDSPRTEPRVEEPARPLPLSPPPSPAIASAPAPRRAAVSRAVSTTEPPPAATTPSEPRMAPPSLEPPAPAVAAPTRESVRVKLGRADAALRAARTRGDDVRALEATSRDALEAYAEGRFDDADRMLERILVRLAP